MSARFGNWLVKRGVPSSQTASYTSPREVKAGDVVSINGQRFRIEEPGR